MTKFHEYFEAANLGAALLVTMLHEQNHYSWVTATREGFHLARAAATFGDARANYESVLPDLENSYRIAKDWLHAGFDPRAVARAELAWWMARRTPGQDSVVHPVEEFLEVHVHYPPMPRRDVLAGTLDRLMRAPSRSKAVARVREGRVEDG